MQFFFCLFFFSVNFSQSNGVCDKISILLNFNIFALILNVLSVAQVAEFEICLVKNQMSICDKHKIITKCS